MGEKKPKKKKRGKILHPNGQRKNSKEGATKVKRETWE